VYGCVCDLFCMGVCVWVCMCGYVWVCVGIYIYACVCTMVCPHVIESRNRKNPPNDQPTNTYLYNPNAYNAHTQQQGGEEFTFDFEGDDEEEEEEEEGNTGSAAAAGAAAAPTPDDDPYVLWPPEVEKMPLGDICFLLRSGVIAAKNVPERRAGACACVCVGGWGGDECVCVCVCVEGEGVLFQL
jgi:hypothetical protein